MKRFRYTNPVHPCLTSPCWFWTEQSSLCLLQEHQQMSEQWEKQRVQYQQHVKALELQNKNLTNELTHMKVNTSILM